jgi:hypothetical protein
MRVMTDEELHKLADAFGITVPAARAMVERETRKVLEGMIQANVREGVLTEAQANGLRSHYDDIEVGDRR